jgi:hypothetical protein
VQRRLHERVARQQHPGLAKHPEREVDADRVQAGVTEQPQVACGPAADVEDEVVALGEGGEPTHVGDRTPQPQRLLVGAGVLVVGRHALERAIVELHAWLP